MMDNYRQMAVKYLKLNKRRSIVTVLGVAVAVTILYAMLNLGWCRLLQQRRELREKQDYEIVFLTATVEQAEQIMADDRVKSASVGQYYDGDYYNPVMYEKALYINTNNPYRLEQILEELADAYGVEGRMNRDLASTYLQGDEGNMTFILILYVLLISYIFAIFGVGIVRNAIQLSILEQIKDYGNLRCIGSTKEQLKTIVYIQGAILELSGNALGILLGFIASLIIGHFLKWEMGFHIIPIIPILIAFLGDLYFAMQENCKVLVNMTPVSAIRGEYRIRKEKIKVRKKNIFGKLFGVEGDYAYKSIMRNPGRFHKTVWALGVGMAAFMAVMVGIATANGRMKAINDLCGYYHVYYNATLQTTGTIDETKGTLPSADVMEAISNMTVVSDAKRLYSAEVILKDYEANFEHYTEEYLNYTLQGQSLEYLLSDIKEDGGFDYIGDNSGIIDIICYGYDETDYQRYQQALVAGTLDVSENGIVLVNGGSAMPGNTNGITESDEEYNPIKYNKKGKAIKYNELGNVDVKYTDYKIGDTIDIIDMEQYRSLWTEKLEQLTAEYEKELAKLPKLTEEEQNDYRIFLKTPQGKLHLAYAGKCRQAVKELREKLTAEGNYKTYTIEGIVSRDVNHYAGDDSLEIVLPLNRYFALTGTDASAITGMQYHFDMFSELEFDEMVNDIEGGDAARWTVTEYPKILAWIVSLKMLGRGALLFITFVMMMTTFNIINTTASNLHLRRREFAQLRVIGVSKKGLMKMVMLEGVISSLTANLISIILGTLLSFPAFGMVVTMIGGRMHFPFLGAVIGIVVSTLILCGSIYVPLKELKQDMAADLATRGD